MWDVDDIAHGEAGREFWGRVLGMYDVPEVQSYVADVSVISAPASWPSPVLQGEMLVEVQLAGIFGQ